MSRRQIKKFDDNTLFKYLSRSYSKKKSVNFVQQINTIKNSANKNFTKITNLNKIRSKSSSIRNQLTKSQTISESYYDTKPGFLKYKRYSINQTLPLNSSIVAPSKSFNRCRWSCNQKSAYEKDFSQLKQTVNDFTADKEYLRNFGLRNAVLPLKNQFRLENRQQYQSKEINEQGGEQILCEKSRRMFLGQKDYNLNGFVTTENVPGYNKAKRSIISQTIRTSIIRKNLKGNHHEKHLLTEA